MRRIAVVGAGLSGLAAARHLAEAGVDVTVFDKGRRPGGRANTREHGKRRFDHGAQYFTVRSGQVRPILDDWLRAGVVVEWSGRVVYIDESGGAPAKAATRYVAVPGMVDLALHLASGLDVRSEVRIESVKRADNDWSLRGIDGRVRSGFHDVVVAVPAPQAVPLLASSPELQVAARRVAMEPCWAVMLSFDEPLELDFDAAFVRSGPLSWIARDSSKPGRPEDEAWVLHVGAESSRSLGDAAPEAVAALAYEALAELLPVVPEPAFRRTHRWGYALASGSGEGILLDSDLGLGACGDWCVGSRVEGALTSGLEIARRLTGEAGPTAHDRGAAAAPP